MDSKTIAENFDKFVRENEINGACMIRIVNEYPEIICSDMPPVVLMGALSIAAATMNKTFSVSNVEALPPIRGL